MINNTEPDDFETRTTFVDVDGTRWEVAALAAGGFGSTAGKFPAVSECVLSFARPGEVRLANKAPMRWNTPELLAELFARSKRVKDD